MVVVLILMGHPCWSKWPLLIPHPSRHLRLRLLRSNSTLWRNPEATEASRKRWEVVALSINNLPTIKKAIDVTPRWNLLYSNFLLLVLRHRLPVATACRASDSQFSRYLCLYVVPSTGNTVCVLRVGVRLPAGWNPWNPLSGEVTSATEIWTKICSDVEICVFFLF